MPPQVMTMMINSYDDSYDDSYAGRMRPMKRRNSNEESRTTQRRVLRLFFSSRARAKCETKDDDCNYYLVWIDTVRRASHAMHG